MKYRNIVVAGDVGTGTTTLARSLSEQLGWKYVAAGDFFRAYALEHKLKLWNKAAVPDEIEKEIDTGLINTLKKERGWVVDSHYAGWFVRDREDIFKILLTCERQVATKRMQEREHTHTETAEEIEKRRLGLYAKFKKLYSSENYENPSFFDLVIDTTKVSAEETLTQVLNSLKSSTL